MSPPPLEKNSGMHNQQGAYSLLKKKQKTHAYFHTILKAPVKFQKNQPNNCGRSYEDKARTPYTLLWYKVLKKKSKLKMQKSDKNDFRILKKNTCVSSDHSKSTDEKFQKDQSKTEGGVARTKSILPIHFYDIRALKRSS